MLLLHKIKAKDSSVCNIIGDRMSEAEEVLEATVVGGVIFPRGRQLIKSRAFVAKRKGLRSYMTGKTPVCILTVTNALL